MAPWHEGAETIPGSRDSPIRECPFEPLPFPAARATLRVFRIDSAHYSAPTRNFIQPLAEGNAAAVGARASLRGMHWEGVVEPFSLLHFEVEIPDDCA